MVVSPSTRRARKFAPFTFAFLMIADLIIIAAILFISFPKCLFVKFALVVFVALPYVMITISFNNFFYGDCGSVVKASKLNKEAQLKHKNKLFVCLICKQLVPPRAFHCDKCGECHLKMCQHIDLFGKCVALKNQRPFIVMLKWIAVSQFVDAIVSFSAMLHEDVGILFGLTVSVVYSSIGLLFEIFWDSQMRLVKNNHTQFEKTKEIPSRLYDLGMTKNIEQVFGKGFFRYYIPSRSEQTGYEWLEDNEDDY